MPARPIVHFEIPLGNPETENSFYRDLFGWETEHTVSTPEPYVMFRLSETMGGGFMKSGDFLKLGQVLMYIGSEDIDADLERIQEKGGKIEMSKTEVMDYGYMAVFTDPVGNRLALWEPKAMNGASAS